jgi:hypothetical protein
MTSDRERGGLVEVVEVLLLLMTLRSSPATPPEIPPFL